MVVAVPKQQLDPVLGQLRKESGIPAGRNFQTPSPVLSTTGLPGQAELTEHPALPEQALPTVARLIEALEKQGTENHGPHPQGTAGGTHSHLLCSVQSAPRASLEPNLSRCPPIPVGRAREGGVLSPCLLPPRRKGGCGLSTDPSLPSVPQGSTARCSTGPAPACWGMLS